jgi:signal transduction histidine kinase
MFVDGDPTGEWDADRLQQIASNLVGNAIQHGDVAEPIIVRVDGSAAEQVVLSVGNSGVIPEELLPSLFDPFHAGRHRRSEGLGLGLYIAQQIAEAHHGTIRVESAAPEGTVFTVCMPRRLEAFMRV